MDDKSLLSHLPRSTSTSKQQIIKPLKIFLILISFTAFILFILSKVNFTQLAPAYIIEYIEYNKENTKNLTFNETTYNCEPVFKNFKPYRIEFNKSIYPKSVPLYLNRSINFECLQNTKQIKTILFWTPFFGDWSFSYGLGVETPFVTQNCPVTKCELTNDKTKVDRADLVLVHMRDSISAPPKYRPENQRWIFSLYESPPHSPTFKQYNSFFNLTSTYRVDSDLAHFYAAESKIEWQKNESFNESYDFSSEKSDFGAAVISNCGGSSKRLEYIKELQKYVSIDVYGKCGKKCPNKFKNSQPGDCKEILAKEYKFFLAFENSICKDYITEKFFVILKYNIVPVVLGGGTYEHYIPKSGFINVKDYESPKALADYLLYLDKNKEAYNSYFKWKKHVIFIDKVPGFSPICSMCIQLHLEWFTGIKKQTIDDIHDYWHKDTCINPKLTDEKFQVR